MIYLNQITGHMKILINPLKMRTIHLLMNYEEGITAYKLSKYLRISIVHVNQIVDYIINTGLIYEFKNEEGSRSVKLNKDGELNQFVIEIIQSIAPECADFIADLNYISFLENRR